MLDCLPVDTLVAARSRILTLRPIVLFRLFGKPPPGYIPGRGRGATGFAGGVSRDDSIDYTQGATDKSDLSDANFDPFTGYAENLFNDAE